MLTPSTSSIACGRLVSVAPASSTFAMRVIHQRQRLALGREAREHAA
jgi:hypothetical protein